MPKRERGVARISVRAGNQAPWTKRRGVVIRLSAFISMVLLPQGGEDTLTAMIKVSATSPAHGFKRLSDGCHPTI